MRFGPTMLVLFALTTGCRECRNPSQPHTNADAPHRAMEEAPPPTPENRPARPADDR